MAPGIGFRLQNSDGREDGGLPPQQLDAQELAVVASPVGHMNDFEFVDVPLDSKGLGVRFALSVSGRPFKYILVIKIIKI